MTVTIPSEVHFYNKLGRRIRAARIDRGMTQQQLADALNYEAHVSVAHWESGALRPSLYVLLRMEAILETKLHDC